MPINFRSSPTFVSVVSGGQSYDGDIRVDVVAVPAVGADPIATWQAGGHDGSETWLEEDLLISLPIARVLFYDHGHPADGDGIDQLARRLLDQLLTVRDTAGPLLAFMCHSTGGLVVKQALVLAQNDDKYSHIVASTVGIAFFSVPHRGSELLSDPNFSADARKAANTEWRYDKPHKPHRHLSSDHKRCYRFQLPSLLCSELRPVILEAPKEGETREVSYLVGLAEAFSDLLNSIDHEIRLWSYYEVVQAGLTTRRPGRDGRREPWFKDLDDLIVSADSARLWREDEELDIGLPCDHYGIPSFDTMYSEEYGSIQLEEFPDRKYKAALCQQLHSLVSERYWPDGDPMHDIQAENMFFFQTRRGLESASVCRSIYSLLDDDFGDFLAQIDEKDAIETPIRPILVPQRALEKSKARKQPAVSALKSSMSYKSHLAPDSIRSSSDHAGDGDNQHGSSQGREKHLRFSEVNTSPLTGTPVISDVRLTLEPEQEHEPKSQPQYVANHTVKRKPSTNGSPHFDEHASTVKRGSVSSGPISNALWGFEVSVSETPLYRFRWIHAPYTHTEIAKTILEKIIKKMPPKQQRFDVISDKFWLKKQNTATHSSPHARYLHSTCEFLDATVKDVAITEELRELLSEKGSKIVSSLSDYISKSKEKDSKSTDHQGENDVCKASQMVLYLPYLHWESFKHLNRRELVIKERMKSNRKFLKTAHCMRDDPEPFERPPSIVELPSGPNEKYPFGQTEATPSAEQKSVEDDLINEVSMFKKIKKYVENSPELRFLWHYIIPGDLLHCRRSLDQYMYSTLPDTSARDQDQILHKCTRKGIANLSGATSDQDGAEDLHDASNDIDETGNVLVVDQLWMWVMDDASVVTLFPPKEVELSNNKDKPAPAHSSAVDLDPSNFISARLIAEGDLRTCIQREIEESDEPFNHQWDLAAFIVKHVVTALFDRFENSGPQALRNFAEYIDRLIEKQATSWASLNLRRGLSLADSSKEIKQVFQDLRDLRELRDVEDELRIITKILGKQNVHLSKMQRMYGKHLGLGKSKGARYLHEALSIIERKQEQVQRMTTNMEMAKKGCEELISLQQNQISINQAVAAGKQSRAVTIFTVFTVFFLPLSFFTSLYGMNVSEWGGNPGTVKMKVILSTMIPLSFVVITLAFLFAMNSSFREAVTSSFEIFVECIIMIMEFIGKWSGIAKLSTWFSSAKKRTGTGWIHSFKKSVKRHKTQRRKARAEARAQEKREKRLRHRPTSVTSGSEVSGTGTHGNGHRKRKSRWMPFQTSGKRDEDPESDSDDGADSFV